MINFKEKISTFWNQQLSVPKKYPFIMYKEEKNLLKNVLSGSKRHLEFGLGGSTIFTLLESKSEIISVDTNKQWIEFIKSYKIIKINLDKRLKILHVNIGPTKSWGFPIDETYKEKFPDFSSEIYEKINPIELDTVLVDGRFRVACVLQTILKGYQNQNLKILFHDYSIRSDYQVLDKYLEIYKSARTLYVFTIRQDVDLKEIEELYEHYKYIPD